MTIDYADNSVRLTGTCRPQSVSRAMLLRQVRVGDEQLAQMARLPPAGAWEDWNRGGPGRWNFAKRRMHANEESNA